MYSKRMTRALLCALLTAGMYLPLPQHTPTACAETDVWDGTLRRPLDGKGTEENPYLITSAEEFAYLIQNYDNNSGVCRHKYYRLTADLDLNHKAWRYGIASGNNRTFLAHFDGNGHRITNVDLYVSSSASEVHAGLFPQLGGDAEFESVIENLEVEDLRVHFFDNGAMPGANRSFRIGGLVGQMYSNSRIENCVVRNMSNIHLAKAIELADGASYWIGPLAGDVQEQFGGKALSTDVPTARIVHAYGQYKPDLGNLHASKDANSVIVRQQQGQTFEAGDYGKYHWYAQPDGTCSFANGEAHIKAAGISETTGNRMYKVADAQPGKYKYHWTFGGKDIEDKGGACEVPYVAYATNLSVEVMDASGKVIASNGELIDVPDMELHTTSITSVGGGTSYNIKTDVRGNDNDALTSELTYEWYDLASDEKPVGNSSTLIGAVSGHTYLCVAHSAKNPSVAISTICKVGKPIYVNHNGISSDADIARYTFDGKTAYPVGNDANDGTAPETAVRTLQRAIELLPEASAGGSVATNVIVIMGRYDEADMSALGTSYGGKAITTGQKPMLVCGSYGNVRHGSLRMPAEAVLLGNDTRFENLGFEGTEGSSKEYAFFAQNHNVTFGYGITMSHFTGMEDYYGLSHGAFAPMLSVFGGFYNPDVQNFDYQPNTLRVLSGYYGRIIAGSHFTTNCYTSGNIAGSPQHPACTSIVVDIHNADNKYGNPFDVGVIVGGQAGGSCYAVSTINVKGRSRIGRIVGGNIGFGRAAYVKDRKGNLSQRPSDSFFGKSVINIESGIINEVIGASLARSLSQYPLSDEQKGGTLVDSCATYFYGISEINISGGNIRNTIYGAGAGSVMGLSLSDQIYTFDPLIPYNLSNGQLAYGSYKEAYLKFPNIIAPDGSTLHIYDSEANINISGNAHLWGTVHGGGYAHSDQLSTSEALCQSGDVFGQTHVTMTGGTVEGYIYGGSRGSLSYYDNYDLTGYPSADGTRRDCNYFNQVAQLYGDAYVTVSGGRVEGMIFGAGEGCYYKPVSATDATNNTASVSALYGNTHVTIDGQADVRDYIFGAGNYSDVLAYNDDEKQGNTYVEVRSGKLGNTIFGGGHGHYDYQNPQRSVTADIQGNTNVLVTGGEFAYYNRGSRYSDTRYYGVLGSGRTSSIVHGDTHVDIRRSLLGQALLDSIGMHNWNDGKPWDKHYCIAGGGFADCTDVMGDTYVTIDVDDLTADEEQAFAALSAQPLKDQQIVPGLTFTDVIGGGLTGHVHGSTHVRVQGRPIIRNIYGGGLQGDCGLRDRDMNGKSIFDHSNSERNYTTRTVTDIVSGRVMRVFGGSLMGDICGETEVNVGVAGDTVGCSRLVIDRIIGGNDVAGSIAGSNNERYGTHVNVNGGTVTGSIFGAGDGSDINQEHLATLMGTSDSQRPFLRERPHVASTMISIKGNSPTQPARIMGNVYVGGNSTTVGLFDRDSLSRSDLGLFREVLHANSGRAAINIGDNVSIDYLVMGSNGQDLLESVPYSTTDGQHWYQGFLNDDDFRNFCRFVDMPCVPALTFNADGTFHNDHAINDLMGDILEFNTPGEMDARNVCINNFVGGGYRGSMTSDSCYIYTLPTGVVIGNQVVGGSLNAHFAYTEREGAQQGTTRQYSGGIAPYHDDFIRTDRVQLNLFNRFADIKGVKDASGRTVYSGAKVFGGCLDYGIVMGYVSLNFHADILGNHELEPGESWSQIAKDWGSEVGYIYAAGKGENTEILGATYINIRGALFNGEQCIPNCLNVFGGGMAGRVVGRTNVSVDIQCKGSSAKEAMTHAVWGTVYGGGRMGDVCMQSSIIPTYRSPRTAETHVRVYSGQIGEVYGGARAANIENGTWVEINDRSTEHFHTMISRVFGGNDLSGTIGGSQQISRIGGDTIRTNTYVSITERQHEDGTYSGFPLITEVYGGGNGDYGIKGSGEVYAGGEVFTLSDTILLAGRELPNIDTTYIEVTGGTIMSLYGGANCGNVRKVSHIAVDYADNRDSKAHFDRTASESCYKRGKTFIIEPYIKDAFTDDGVALNLRNNICRLYGGNNSSPLLIQPEYDLRRADIGTIYGGCNMGDVLYYNEQGDRLVNPGTPGSPGLWLVLDNEDLHIDNVFGGSRMGDIRASRITYNADRQRNDTTAVTFDENQYGSIIVVKSGTYGRIFGGNDVAGNVPNGTHISLMGGQVGEVYGAGNGNYIYKWNPDVSRVTELWDADRHDYVYHVPAVSAFGGRDADDVQKIQSINEYRPNVTKSFVEVNGTPGHLAVVTDGVYSGGHSATVVGANYTSGYIKMDLGDYIIINNVYMGSNGEQYVGRYADELMAYNGITNYDQQHDGTSLLDVLMAPVAIYGLPKDFHFRSQYSQGYIGSFYLGGRRGSLIADGMLDVAFPRSLKIYDKIVGGPDRADVLFTDPMGNKLTYHGGVLWNKKGQKPEINIDLQCDFINATFDATNGNTADAKSYLNISDESVDNPGGHVYSGCYQSGQVEGAVNIEINGFGGEEEIFF